MKKLNFANSRIGDMEETIIAETIQQIEPAKLAITAVLKFQLLRLPLLITRLKTGNIKLHQFEHLGLANSPNVSTWDILRDAQ